MTSPSGINPPLHRRFDERQAKSQIRNRYANCKKRIKPQVTTLQACKAFRRAAQALYERGNKDWMILMAVYNVRVNRTLIDRGIDMRDARAVRSGLREVAKIIFDDSLPSSIFLGQEFDRALSTFHMTALITWGFHPRAQLLNADVVEQFLRQRMNHFEYDLPHKPLFGEPPGKWPTIKGASF